MEEIHFLKGYARVQYRDVRELTSEMIAHDMIDCRTHTPGSGAGGTASKNVTAHTHGYDKYKHTIANVLLSDGTNVNYSLVKQGWCWWYRK